MSIPILLDGVVSSLIRTAIHNDLLQVKLSKNEREILFSSAVLPLRARTKLGGDREAETGGDARVAGA